MSKRVQKLKRAIESEHKCRAHHEGGEYVETSSGYSIWEDLVDSFELKDHPYAKRRYAWSYGDGVQMTFATELEHPPIDSARAAVQAAILAASKPALPIREIDS